MIYQNMEQIASILTYFLKSITSSVRMSNMIDEIYDNLGSIYYDISITKLQSAKTFLEQAKNTSSTQHKKSEICNAIQSLVECYSFSNAALDKTFKHKDTFLGFTTSVYYVPLIPDEKKEAWKISMIEICSLIYLAYNTINEISLGGNWYNKACSLYKDVIQNKEVDVHVLLRKNNEYVNVFEVIYKIMNAGNNKSWWTSNKIVVLSLVGIMVLSAPIAIPALLNCLFSDAHIMCKAEQYYTSFIALCTTFVVGFQIYNTLEWKERFKELEAEKDEICRKIKELEEAKLECKYYNSYTIGKIHFAASQAEYNSLEVNIVSSRYCWNTARAFSNALFYASLGGHNIVDSYENFGEKLEMSITQIIKTHSEYNIGSLSGKQFQELNNKDFPEYSVRRIIAQTIYEKLTAACVNLRNSGEHDKTADKIKLISKKWKNFVAVYYPDVL